MGGLWPPAVHRSYPTLNVYAKTPRAASGRLLPVAIQIPSLPNPEGMDVKNRP